MASSSLVSAAGSTATTPSLDAFVPEYRGDEPFIAPLPKRAEPWFLDDNETEYDSSLGTIREHARRKPWVWPGRRVYFLCDLHADADAFFRSAVATGGVEKVGPRDEQLELTDAGRGATFVIGGDCFDKGPDNLRLLRALRTLVDTGADVRFLAGNHDLRTLLGIRSAGSREVTLQHLFVRMGKKTIPLFKEIWDTYLEGVIAPGDLRDPDEIKRELFPDEAWFDAFPDAVQGLIPELKVLKEVRRIREKMRDVDETCAALGLSLPQVDAALRKARELFLDDDGEFAWLFSQMTLAARFGSFLFVHAGVDDEVARLIRDKGVEGLNREYARMTDEALFELYNGSVGNTFRTKYREGDRALTYDGVVDLHAAGVYAIVHGHRNLAHGQRVVVRSGVLNFECDCSVDRNTRALEGIAGDGGAATVFRDDGVVLGISTDRPAVRIFDPGDICDTITVVRANRAKAEEERR